jgi:hypothetical protein
MPDMISSSGFPAEALPHVPKRELIARYKARVEGVQKWREDEGYDDTWKRLRDVYRLRMFTANTQEDRVLVAVAFATINVIEPSVAINYPKITVTANHEDELDEATISEAVINYLWRHHDVQPEFRRAVKDYLVYGHGWLKVGYRYEEVARPVTISDQADNFDSLSAQADEFAAANPHLAGYLPSDGDIARSIPESEPFVIHDHPFVDRVSPFDVFVDPEATFYYTADRTDAAWLCQRVVRPYEEAKRDPRYRQTARRKLEPDGSVAWQLDDSSDIPGDCDRVTLWEFYDLRRRTVCVFADNLDEFLVDPMALPYSYGAPFIMLRDYDVPDQFYPIGELEALEPLQNELNETRSSMVRARKLDIRKYMARKGQLNADAVSAIRSDEDNAIIVVDGDHPLNDVLVPVQTNPARPELYQHSETVLSDFDRVSGVSEYQRGQLPEIRRTATEASIIQDAANARAADKLDTVQLAVGQVARRILQLMQQYMDEEQSARIVGTDGTKMWFKYQRDDIQGEFDFEVEAGSTQPMNETFRRQQAMQMMTALQPLISEGVIDPRELAKHVLRDGFGIKQPEKLILPPPPPQPGPNVKLVETMAYKDTPPDIQRQIEEAAGLTPSISGTLPAQPSPDGNAGEQSGNYSDRVNTKQQLSGQVGLSTGDQQQPNGGGALGPGGQK